MKARFIAVVLCLLTVAAFGQPNPKLKEVQYFEGTWQCSGKAFASPMGPEHTTAAIVHADWVLGGAWLQIHYAEKKTAANAHPYDVQLFWGYDAQLKMLVDGSVDNMGGYSTEQSAGWQGDKLIFAGPTHSGGMTMTGRDVFTKKSKSELHHVFEFEEKGTWKPLAEETCTR
jgi:hypothetical protein